MKCNVVVIYCTILNLKSLFLTKVSIPVADMYTIRGGVGGGWTMNKILKNNHPKFVQYQFTCNVYDKK